MDPETIALLKQLGGPETIALVATIVVLFELRVRAPLLRAFAGHRAVARKLGVTDDEIAAELKVLKGGREATGA